MSGHISDVVTRHGVSDSPASFSSEALYAGGRTSKVRAVLNSPRVEPGYAESPGPSKIQQRTIFSRNSVTARVAFRVSSTSRAWRTMKA